MKYIIKYINNHEPIAYELKPRQVRVLSDTLFLVKIKRNVTIPRVFQTKDLIYKVRKSKKWYVCEQKQITKDYMILEFYTGIDVFKYVEERLANENY